VQLFYELRVISLFIVEERPKENGGCKIFLRSSSISYGRSASLQLRKGLNKMEAARYFCAALLLATEDQPLYIVEERPKENGGCKIFLRSSSISYGRSASLYS
jgi:hypothetical protein